MLKICLITPNLLPVPSVNGGAIENLVTNVVREQEKEGRIDLTVVSIYSKKAFEESKIYSKTKFIYIKKNLFYAFLGCIYNISNRLFKTNLNTYNHIVLRKIKSMNFDYIIAEGGHYESFNEFLKYFSRDKMILHLHHQGKSNEIIDKTFSKLIGVSKFVTDDFAKSTKVIETKYLNNGIDLSKFDKDVSDSEKLKIRKKYGIKKDDFLVLYCGRLTKVKGVLELIKAVRATKRKDIKLLILGSNNFLDGKGDEYTEKLKDEVQGYESQIIFTGYVNNWDIYKYYACGDIVCVPSLCEEAAGLVCIEAMLCRKVILATRSGGMSEYLSSDSSLIVEKDENIVDNLKNGILTLYKKKDKLESMGIKAYEHAKKFNSNNYYDELIMLLMKFKEESNE